MIDETQGYHDKKPRPGEHFLKGPIPWPWILAAGRLPGKALQVGLLLWREAGCANHRTVRLNLRQGAALGMHRDTTRRALQALRRAGLVTVNLVPGARLEVTINEAPSAS
jgi:hypothetical protein